MMRKYSSLDSFTQYQSHIPYPYYYIYIILYLLIKKSYYYETAISECLRGTQVTNNQVRPVKYAGLRPARKASSKYIMCALFASPSVWRRQAMRAELC